MSETFAALVPSPHPVAVFRVLKQAWRDYMASGYALVLTVSNPANQAATATTVVTGTVSADASVPTPIQVSVALRQSGTTKATLVATPNAAGNYGVTFPANTLVAGSASVQASALYATTVTSNTFTVT